MAVSEKRQKLFGGFNRLRDFPLDASALYDTKAELDEYLLTNKTAYEGQLVVIKQGIDQGVYRILFNEDKGLHVGKPLATGEDVVRAFEDIATLYENVNEHDQRISSNLDWIRTISETYASKSELDGEIRKLLGEDYANIKTELNSIYELSEELDRVLILLYEGLNGKTYSDIVSAVLMNLNDIRAVSTRLDEVTSALNAKIASDRERLTALENFQAVMTDQHILDVVNTEGLENVEYKESFFFNGNNKCGRFIYDNNFILTKASITVNSMRFNDNLGYNQTTYSMALKIANTDSFITDLCIFPIEETKVSVDFPLINTIPDNIGPIEIFFSNNVGSTDGLVSINYTKVPR